MSSFLYTHKSQIKEIASRNQVSPAQLLISWAIQRGTSVIPKAARLEHMVENQKLISLSVEDMGRIDSVAANGGEGVVKSIRFLDPKDYIGFDIFDEAVDQPAQ